MVPSPFRPVLRASAVLLLALPLFVLPLVALPLIAQDSTRTPARSTLPPLRVTAVREGPRSSLELPYAVTVAAPDSLAALRRLGVDELLFAVPGLALANRQNPAQDPRVSIRGFGARSAFGVRGVRVLQDGVPVTLPDGQTPVDALDIEGARRIEVVRGSASSLYGNAAGGVIDLRSAAPANHVLEPSLRIVGGGDSPTLIAGGASGTLGAGGYTSSITRVNGAGYRDHSDQRATRAAVRVTLADPAEHAGLSVAIAARLVDVTRADSPGALTRAQLDATPRMADPLSVRKQAGKIVRQSDLSLTVGHPLGSSGAIDASVFGSRRTLANPLTFATVDVERESGGALLRLTGSHAVASRAARGVVGTDVQWQRDGRLEHDNCADATAVTLACPQGAALRGALRKDQRELVTSVGPYLRGELALAPSLIASAGVRADAVRFEVRDQLVSATNPDDSGSRTLHSTSPAVGLVWRPTALSSLYASMSSSFETPTTTELGNKPDGSAGINPDLRPQHTVTLELGGKGVVTATPLRWDVALFEARARDELVPFDIAGGGGRRYFRNAGRTVRRGAEVGLDAAAGPLDVRGAYTWSRFRYEEYVVGAASYAGHRIPGIPEHAVNLATSLRRGSVTISTTADLASAVDVDDANSAQAPGRAILGLAVGGTMQLRGVRLAPLAALQNIGGVRSAGSVSVNATGGKFYEPAPGRILLVRLALAHGDGEMP